MENSQNNFKYLSELVNLGYEIDLVKKVLSYFKPTSLLEAEGYLKKDNGLWLHPFSSQGDGSDKCYVCKEIEEYHVSNEMLLYSNELLHLHSHKDPMVFGKSMDFARADISNTPARKFDFRTFIEKRPKILSFTRKENTIAECGYKRKSKISPDSHSKKVRKSRSITNFIMKKLKSFESEDSAIGPQDFRILKSPNPHSYTFAYASVHPSPKRRDSKDNPACNECYYTKETTKLKCGHYTCKGCITNIIEKGVNNFDLGLLICKECMKLYSKDFILEHLHEPRIRISFLKLYYGYRNNYDDIKEFKRCPYCSGYALRDYLHPSCLINESTTNQLDKSGEFMILPKKMKKSLLYLKCENDHQFCYICEEMNHEQGFCPYEESYPQPEIKCLCGNVTKKVHILTNEFECTKCKRKVCFICKDNDISSHWHYYNPFNTCLFMKYIAIDSLYVTKTPIKLLRHLLIITLMIMISPFVSLLSPLILLRILESYTKKPLPQIIMKKIFLKAKEGKVYFIFLKLPYLILMMALIYMIPIYLMLTVIIIMNLVLSLFYNFLRCLILKLSIN